MPGGRAPHDPIARRDVMRQLAMARTSPSSAADRGQRAADALRAFAAVITPDPLALWRGADAPDRNGSFGSLLSGAGSVVATRDDPQHPHHPEHPHPHQKPRRARAPDPDGNGNKDRV
ncbi:hypothetical protein rosag_10030 [Roseisolibacter agri]|uniref:Uncharacterized protein n=1 Tax=Roseisolibacter agri TaxID=2014610 RepID=A0AA37V0H5_9BACT|nr:hypothetical protein rosag_10030 [Roseisolibacter agri]